MGINTALSTAIGGLANVNAGLSVVSQNIANASTPGYVVEASTQHSLTADGMGMGVASGPAVRVLNAQQQTDVFNQNAVVSGLQIRQAALGNIDSVLGTPGQGNDLASLLGQVQSSFSALLSAPDSAAQQNAVVNAAQNFAGQLNTLGSAVTSTRQQAQDAIVTGVTTLNTTIATIATQTKQIMATRAAGQSSADLENQRDVSLTQLSNLIDVRFLKQDNGDLKAITPSGLSINFQPGAANFATQTASIGAASSYPGGGIPAITMNGVNVTGQLAGAGALGGNIDVRDNIMPGLQAGLDEVAQTTSTRFQAQGLTLFTQPSGTVPTGGGAPAQSTYLGYASTIMVNPAVIQNPALVRDGTNAVAGSPTGASAFTPNPPAGPTGFTTLITRVLTNAMGVQAQPGIAQPAPNNNGLGPQGNLVGPFSAGGSLATMTAAVMSGQAQQSSAMTNKLDTEKAVQTTLTTNLSQSSSVSIDNELSLMVQLQNAYGANARVLSAIQSMWTQLLQTVQ